LRRSSGFGDWGTEIHSSRPIFSKRTLLVAALLIGQLLCLLAALAVFGRWLDQGLTRIVRQRVLMANRQIASEIGRLIDRMELPTVTPDSDGWQHVQTLIEGMHLPNGAFFCLVDGDTGRVISHLQLKNQPELAQVQIVEAIASNTYEWRTLEDGSHLLIARTFPKLGVKLLAHQPESALHAITLAFVQRMRLIGVCVAVVLVSLMAILSFTIIRAYDNRLAAINQQLEQIVEQRSGDVLRSRDAAVFGLAMLAEKRDGETGEHLERISDYTELLAMEFVKQHPELELDQRWVHTLKITSALHDIGKVGIPDAVLRKPASLTEDERHVIQQHPHIGGDTLLELKHRWGQDMFLTIAGQICLGHHERWDGGGYPFGLKGDEITLPARVVSLADVYDALTSRRRYKEPMSHEKAKQMIADGSGSQFDPQVVEVFLICEKKFEQIAFHTRREITEPV